MIAGRRTRLVPPPSIPSCTSYPPPASDPPRSPPARSPVATLQSRRHLPSEKRRCLCLPLWTNFPPEPNPSLPTGHAPPHAGLSLLRFYRFEFFGAPAPRPSCPFCDCACVHGAGTLQAVSPLRNRPVAWPFGADALAICARTHSHPPVKHHGAESVTAFRRLCRRGVL